MQRVGQALKRGGYLRAISAPVVGGGEGWSPGGVLAARSPCRTASRTDCACAWGCHARAP